ncbi:MAG TPA: nuclear transport factor 2 family protein [Kofleriaceae bacterium]|nr:nuclear transport factor 2 family protein [Kofleriaceae bacterium]
MSRASLLLPALAACAPAPAHPATADLVAEVRAAAAAFDDAQLHGDRATLDRFLAADFVFIRGAGVVADRAAFLAAFSDPDQRFEPFEIVDRRAIVLGDAAVLIGGEATIRGTAHGAPFQDHFHYADIFQRRDGRWQVVYTQVTPIQP